MIDPFDVDEDSELNDEGDEYEKAHRVPIGKRNRMKFNWKFSLQIIQNFEDETIYHSPHFSCEFPSRTASFLEFML